MILMENYRRKGQNQKEELKLKGRQMKIWVRWLKHQTYLHFHRMEEQDQSIQQLEDLQLKKEESRLLPHTID